VAILLALGPKPTTQNKMEIPMDAKALSRRLPSNMTMAISAIAYPTAPMIPKHNGQNSFQTNPMICQIVNGQYFFSSSDTVTLITHFLSESSSLARLMGGAVERSHA
jgi:hypothetical protein